MSLPDILEPLRKEIEADDMVRETSLPLSRDAVRKCSLSIKAAHRGDYEGATQLLNEAHEIISKARQGMSQSKFMSKSRTLNVADQELAEAANVISLFKTGVFTPPEQFSIPSRAYLTGLADTVGELRRGVLDSIRTEKINHAEKLLGFMVEIFEQLHSFDFPNALIPELRRKCDVARSLIERTRGDLTTAVGQTKLVSELKSFEKRMNKE